MSEHLNLGGGFKSFGGSESYLTCAVCGEYIMPIKGAFSEPPQPFMVENCTDVLYCHATKCKDIVVEMSDKDDWTILPDGPLRRGFEKANV